MKSEQIDFNFEKEIDEPLRNIEQEIENLQILAENRFSKFISDRFTQKSEDNATSQSYSEGIHNMTQLSLFSHKAIIEFWSDEANKDINEYLKDTGKLYEIIKDIYVSQKGARPSKKIKPEKILKKDHQDEPKRDKWGSGASLPERDL
jgi:hypothetical protein